MVVDQQSVSKIKATQYEERHKETRLRIRLLEGKRLRMYIVAPEDKAFHKRDTRY